MAVCKASLPPYTSSVLKATPSTQLVSGSRWWLWVRPSPPPPSRRWPPGPRHAPLAVDTQPREEEAGQGEHCQLSSITGGSCKVLGRDAGSPDHGRHDMLGNLFE